jgi:CysZ protein
MSAGPGFGAGVRSLFRGFASLWGRPALWPYALVPTLLLLCLNGVFVFSALHWLRPELREWLPSTPTWYGEFGVSLLVWIGTLLAAFAGVLVSLVLAPPLSAPALERLVAEEEAELGVPPRVPLGFMSEVWCGFRALAAGLLISLPIIAILFLIELWFPPAAVATVPLKFLTGALIVALGLFDYPLTLRGVTVRDRLGFLRSHAGALVGFGIAFTILFWLPCCGVILLPVGVTAGTRLLYEILEASPKSLPGLPRPSRRSGG